MKPETREWVRCAEEDFEVAVILSRRRKKVPTSSVAFHCQQCVEKYLKTRLEEAGLPVPKTHNLAQLLSLLLSLQPLWAAFEVALLRLNNYAVKFRYPGDVVTRDEARRALRHCHAVRKEARHSLGFPAR